MIVYTIKQVASKLNCSLANVYALIDSGALGFTRVGANGKGLRVSESQLQTFLGSREGKRTDAPRLRFSK